MRRALQLAFLLGVYEFFMFLALAIVTGLGLRAGSNETVVDVESLGASRG